MYEDMYKDYSDETFCYYYDITFEGKSKDYLKPSCVPEVEWNRGDEVILGFNLTSLIPSDDYTDGYFDDKAVNIEFYNWSDTEPIISYQFIPNELDIDDTVITVFIDSDDSKLFKPGMYYYSIKVADVEEPDINITTLKSRGESFLRVK